MVDIVVSGGNKTNDTPINAPSQLDLQTFISNVSKDGDLSKSSRFLAVINPPQKLLKSFSSGYNAQELVYLCEATELPGRGFIASDVRYYGPNFKIPYQSLYEDINMTFLCKDNFKERAFFDNWMELVNPSNSYDFNYRSDYVSTITIFQMSDVKNGVKGQERYQFRLFEAYPILINSQQVTWADDNFHRITATITYKKWYRPGIDPTLNDSTSQLIQGANYVSSTAIPQIIEPNPPSTTVTTQQPGNTTPNGGGW